MPTLQATAGEAVFPGTRRQTSHGRCTLRSGRRAHRVQRSGEVCLDPARSETCLCSETTCRERGDAVGLLWWCSARGEASRRTTTSHSTREVGSRRSTGEAAEQGCRCNSCGGGGGGEKTGTQGECRLAAHMPHFEADNRCEAIRHATGATLVATGRWNLRLEPYVVAPHVRICGGGAECPASLFRQLAARSRRQFCLVYLH